LAALVVAFVGLSVLSDSRATQHTITATVREFNAGEWMSVANDQTDPMGFQIALRDAVYEGRPGAIKPGVRVTVWFRSIGERLFVADKVSVLADVALR
jgi:hypothetical protein